MLTNILSTAVSGTVVVGGAAWVTTTLVTAYLTRQTEAFKAQVKADADREIEKFKSGLQADANREIEHLKNVLQMRALEHQVRFAKLHERRAEVIAEVDRRLYELEVAGRRYVEGLGRGGNEEYVRWRNEFIECNSFLNSNQIYLTEQLYRSVSEYLDAVERPPNDVWTITLGEGDGASHALLRQHQTLILEAVENANTKIPAMRHAVIKEFRALLGGIDRMT